MRAIDPVEMAAAEQKRKFLQKSGVVGVLLASVFGAMLLLPRTVPKPEQKKGAVLGEEVKQVEKKPIFEQVKSDGTRVKAYLTDQAGKVVEQGEAVIGGQIGEAKITATEYINEKALAPLVEYLQKLPQDQKEYVTQELCAPLISPTPTPIAGP